MRALLLLVAFCHLVECSTVRKCCQDGQSLWSWESYLECRNSTHNWSYAHIEYGLPMDCVPEIVTPADEGTPASCVDNINGTDRVVAVKCLDDVENFTVPNIHYLTKCCPMNRSYDSILQTCWGEQKDSWPTGFFNSLMFNAGGVIDVKWGVPQCEENQVVVDHLVRAGNVHRKQTASISFKVGEDVIVMNPDEVCVDRTETRDVFVVRVCINQEIACTTNTCLRKCCPQDQSYFLHPGGNPSRCNQWPTTHVIRPIKVYNFSDYGREPVGFRTPAYWYGMSCDKYIEDVTEAYELDLLGNIYNTAQGTWTEKGLFCIENVANTSSNIDAVFFCFEEEDLKPNIHIWNTLGMVISAFFLFLTFLVYATLPSLRNLHGKTLMCHVSCLFCAYTMLSTVHFITNQILERACVLLGYMTFFSFLAGFFWLNVISFDIWWTFGSMRPVINKKKRECRKFAVYSLYAWLTPTIITLLAFAADNYSGFPQSIQPGIGLESCWFLLSAKGVFLFFIGPSGVLLTLNLVFFIFTAKHCSKVKTDLDRVGHTPIADRKFKSDRVRLVMNSKLFIAMGINWFLEFLSSISFHIHFLPNEIWYLSDMANACQGLVIFSIFVLKRRVLAEIKGRLGGLFFTGRPPPRHPSVSTLYTGTTTTIHPEVGTHVMKKCISESRLSPLPKDKSNRNLAKQPKSKSSNRLYVIR